MNNEARDPTWKDVQDCEFRIRTLQLRLALTEDQLGRTKACPECQKIQKKLLP